METKYILFFLLVTLCGTLLLIGKVKWYFFIVAFLLSFGSPIFRDYGINASIAALIIIITFPLYFSLYLNSPGHYGYMLLVLPFLVYPVVIGIYNKELASDSFINEYYEMINVVIIVVAAAFLVVLLKSGVNVYCSRDDLVYCFSFSVVPQFFGMINSVYYIWPGAPDFLNGSIAVVLERNNGDDIEINRYGALVGDYELLVDYCLQMLSICFFMYAKNKKIPAIIFGLLCIYLGGASGTRSFLVAIIMFPIIFYSMKWYFVGWGKGEIERKGVFFAAIIFAAASLFWSYSEDVAILYRFIDLIYNYSDGANVENLLNRNYSGAFDIVAENIGLLGGGLYYYTTLMGNEIVSHNILFAVYLKWGVPGLVLFIYFVLLAAQKNFAYCKTCKSYTHILVGSFFFIMLAQQMKVSALRGSVGVLIYIFWINVVFYANHQNLLDKSQKIK